MEYLSMLLGTVLLYNQSEKVKRPTVPKTHQRNALTVEHARQLLDIIPKKPPKGLRDFAADKPYAKNPSSNRRVDLFQHHVQTKDFWRLICFTHGNLRLPENLPFSPRFVLCARRWRLRHDPRRHRQEYYQEQNHSMQSTAPYPQPDSPPRAGWRSSRLFPHCHPSYQE